MQATNQMAQVIGSNIRRAREIHGLSQSDLARLIESQGFAVSRWERGLHRPTDATLIRIADVTDRDIAWFYTRHDEPTEEAA